MPCPVAPERSDRSSGDCAADRPVYGSRRRALRSWPLPRQGIRPTADRGGPSGGGLRRSGGDGPSPCRGPGDQVTSPRATVAPSVAAPLDALADSPPPDLVALDVGLPDGDRLDLCRDLKAAHPTLPIVVMSASGGYGAKARKAGADRFIAKPFDPDELASTAAGPLGGKSERGG